MARTARIVAAAVACSREGPVDAVFRRFQVHATGVECAGNSPRNTLRIIIERTIVIIAIVARHVERHIVAVEHTRQAGIRRYGNVVRLWRLRGLGLGLGFGFFGSGCGLVSLLLCLLGILFCLVCQFLSLVGLLLRLFGLLTLHLGLPALLFGVLAVNIQEDAA